MLKHIRYLALDTSHLSGWARDWASSSQSDRKRAQRFEDSLEHFGWVPVITYHHLSELIAYEDDAAVEGRLECLCRLPVLAWVARDASNAGPAAITDIVAAELLALLDHPTASAAEVRSMVRPSLLHVGSGEGATGGFHECWRDLRPYFVQEQKHHRMTVAITGGEAPPHAKLRVVDLMRGRRRAPAEALETMAAMQAELEEDIRTHGDKRIESPAGIASEFYTRVVQTAATLPGDVKNFVVGGLIKKNINPSEIKADTTLADLDENGIFRGQLRIVAEELNIPWRPIFDSFQKEQFPSWVITAGIKRHGQRLEERKGSDLNDIYLAVLAAYADLTLVDKRMHENFKRARTRSDLFRDCAGPVAKAGHYSEITKLLEFHVPESV